MVSAVHRITDKDSPISRHVEFNHSAPVAVSRSHCEVVYSTRTSMLDENSIPSPSAPIRLLHEWLVNRLPAADTSTKPLIEAALSDTSEELDVIGFP